MATLALAVRSSDITASLPHWPAPDLRRLRRLTDDCLKGRDSKAQRHCPG